MLVIGKASLAWTASACAGSAAKSVAIVPKEAAKYRHMLRHMSGRWIASPGGDAGRASLSGVPWQHAYKSGLSTGRCVREAAAQRASQRRD
jgi:hypothetical protein